MFQQIANAQFKPTVHLSQVASSHSSQKLIIMIYYIEIFSTILINHKRDGKASSKGNCRWCLQAAADISSNFLKIPDYIKFPEKFQPYSMVINNKNNSYNNNNNTE